MSIFQRFDERGFVDQPATRAVHDAHASFCFLQTRSIKNMSRFRSERCVQGNEIGSRDQIVHFIEKFDLQTSRARRREIRIVGHYTHPESDAAPAQFSPDSAHADDAKCFVVKLDSFKIFSVPFSAMHDRVGLRNLSRNTKQQGECMFCGGNGIAARRVEHNNATLCRRLDIDVIYANAGAADHAQLRAGIQDISSDFGLTPHNKCTELWNKIDKFALAEAGFDRDLERVVARKFVDPALRNRIGDENLGRSHSSFRF